MGDSGKYRPVVVMVEMIVVVMMVALAGVAQAQMSQNCNITRSVIDANKVDVYCDCMQQLTQMNLPISQLTINQTSCPRSALELSWPDLETLVAPESLTLIGAQVVFAPIPADRSWDASVRSLTFDDCIFDTIPPNAFRGMQSLQKINFLDVSTASIETNAFSGLQALTSVEIANSSITVIQSSAFNNLPSLNDLDFIHSSIGSIENEAISLQRGNVAETRCSNVRSINNSTEVIGDIMGRHLTSVGNLTLPEYGSRLLFFKNNILTVRSRAINAETFGFLIVGGNYIQKLESQAFTMELFNECEISAALFVGNNITELQSLALAGLSGRDGVAFQTFIALSNNTFHQVAEQGFLLDDNLSIFSVEENHFHCDCDSFDWILSNQNSENQQELEKELVLKATCLDGSNFISFTSSCTDHGSLPTNTTTQSPPSPTVTATPARTSARPPVTSPVPAGGASSQTASICSLAATVLTVAVGRTLA